MEFSRKLHTIKSGWSIVYIEGLQVIDFQQILYLFLWRLILALQTVQTLMNCSIMLYFIWIFTASHSTHLGVSGIKMVKDQSSRNSKTYSLFKKVLKILLIIISKCDQKISNYMYEDSFEKHHKCASTSGLP